MKGKLFCIMLMAWQMASAQTAVTIQVNASQGKKSISPYIYGKNNDLSDSPGQPTTAAQWKLYRDAGLRFTRENGGNNATKYNWRLKLSSHPDWYNNVYGHSWDFSAKTLQDSMPAVQGMWAFQLIGYAASTGTQNFNDWGYNHSSWWSGVCQNLAGGGTANTAGGCTALVSGTPARYLESWTADSTVGILDHWFGTGGLGYDKNKIMYWSMDNEPEIWNGTHDDVMLTLPSAETFMQLYFAVAKKSRAKFPGIKLCGPVPANEWQWYNWNGNTINSGGKSYAWLEYFIKRCAEEQQASGVRLLDVLDIHFYPGEIQDSDIVQLHRVFFDTTYNYTGANGVKKLSPSGWDNTIRKEYILHRCQHWLDQYMGTGNGVTLGVSEYGATNNNANVTSVNYASLLGTFADNSVAYFTPWSWNPGMWETLHLYSRYAKTNRVQSISGNEHDVSAYSSVNSTGDSLTVVLVNRSLTASKNATVNISGFQLPGGSYKTFQLSQLPSSETFVSHTNNALKAGTAILSSGAFTLSLPALSTTAVLLSGQLVTGLNEEKSSPETLEIYPNPSQGMFTMRSSSSTRGVIRVYNMKGEKVYQADSTPGITLTIDLSRQQDGIYIASFTTGKGTVTKKIVIQK